MKRLSRRFLAGAVSNRIFCGHRSDSGHSCIGPGGLAATVSSGRIKGVETGGAMADGEGMLVQQQDGLRVVITVEMPQRSRGC